jgi:transposase
MSDKRPVPRPRRDATAIRQLWADRLKKFRTAGLTVAAFCAAEGVSAPAFYTWRRRLSHTAPPAGTPTIVPVRLTTPAPTAPAVEAVLPSGAVVRFGPTCDPAVIAAVLRQLGVAGC